MHPSCGSADSRWTARIRLSLGHVLVSRNRTQRVDLSMTQPMAIAAAAMLISTFASSAAFAQRPQDVARCEGKERPASSEARVRGCTALIQSGVFSAMKLARTFVNRADAYNERGDLDHAIQDLGEAIRLNPLDERSLYTRGNLYLQQGDFDRALQDYDQVLLLNLTRLQTMFASTAKADALYARAAAKEKDGDATGAEADRGAATAINVGIAAAKGAEADIVRVFRRFGAR